MQSFIPVVIFLLAYQCMSSLTLKKPVTLITFDVDGTLLQSSSKMAEAGAHARAFMYAAGKYYSKDPNFMNKFRAPLDVIPVEKYHGSTDGLILLNIIKYAFGIDSSVSFPRLPELFQAMYEYIANLSDEEVAVGISPLPGVLDKLSRMAADPSLEDNLLCGLVTGNVEGIARKKMRACGILQTHCLAMKADDQNWDGENDSAFLGGFGSDYCSGSIDDTSRNYKDRGEQIVIAFQRAKTLLRDDQELVKVVHVGDAPADILAARYCYEEKRFGEGVMVGCIGVATGKFSAAELSDLIGIPHADKWCPIVLEEGMNDPKFIESCGIIM